MTWNYRIVRKQGLDEEYFEVHEVYYNEAGEPVGMTENCATFGGETPEEVIQALELALRDAQSRPVFTPPKEWDNK